MTRLSNAPTGWAAFRAMRKPPTPLPHRLHGNWVHGRYSKARIEGMQELRQLVKILRGAWWLPIPGTDRPKPIGWKAYRIGRPMKRSPMGHKGPREKSFMAAKEISWPR